jgi:L-gulonolactone oxidase
MNKQKRSHFKICFCVSGSVMYKPFGKDIQYQRVFERLSREMERLGGRPHWGKVHHWTATNCAKAYPKWDAFHKVRQRLDPTGLFLNEHLERLFIPNTTDQNKKDI